ILGDFNCDLLKRDSNSFALFNVGKEFKLWQHMIGPTFKGLSLLDLVYSNRRDVVISAGHFAYSSSDHDFTYIIRKVTRPKFQPKFINYRYILTPINSLRSLFSNY